MNLNEKTQVTLDLKTIGIVIGGAISLVTLYFTLQKDIELAKELPKPTITRTEYDLKDQLIRETIMNTQDKVQENSDKLDKIDEKRNKHNNLPVNKMANIKIQFAWLEDQPASIQRNVVSVPTLILMNNGKSIAQWRAGIDLTLIVTEEEIIKAIEIFNKRKK